MRWRATLTMVVAAMLGVGAQCSSPKGASGAPLLSRGFPQLWDAYRPAPQPRASIRHRHL